MRPDDEYYLILGEKTVGWYYVYEEGAVSYTVKSSLDPDALEKLKARGLAKNAERKGYLPFFAEMINDENRVPGTRKVIYEKDGFRLERIPEETGEKFWIYRLSAEKGEPGYGTKRYSAPHREGGKEIEGMSEWAQHYCFVKMDDGTYQAELDEAWCWGGGHNDGGTICTPIPEEWFGLGYGEFLERVVTLSSAAHYGFTADELKQKAGLKEFFGF